MLLLLGIVYLGFASTHPSPPNDLLLNPAIAESLCYSLPDDIKRELLQVDYKKDFQKYYHACRKDWSLLLTLPKPSRDKLRLYAMHYLPYHKWPMQAAISCIVDYQTKCDIFKLIQINAELEIFQYRLYQGDDFIRMAEAAADMQNFGLFDKLFALSGFNIQGPNRAWTALCDKAVDSKKQLFLDIYYQQCASINESEKNLFQRAVFHAHSTFNSPLTDRGMAYHFVDQLKLVNGIPLGSMPFEALDVLLASGYRLDSQRLYNGINYWAEYKLGTIFEWFYPQKAKTINMIIETKNQFQLIDLLSFVPENKPAVPSEAWLQDHRVHLKKIWECARIRLVQLGYSKPHAFAIRYASGLPKPKRIVILDYLYTQQEIAPSSKTRYLRLDAFFRPQKFDRIAAMV